jgi:hypothetical protein
MLTWCLRPVPWSVLVVPVGWSVIATVAAVSFGVFEDFALQVAAALAVVVLARPARHGSPGAHGGRRPLELGF